MNMPNEIFLTSQQAAELLHISLSTLKKFIYLGKIKTLLTPGGHHRILKNDLFEMFKLQVQPGQHTAKPSGPSSLIARELADSLDQKRRFCKGYSQKVAQLSSIISEQIPLSVVRKKRLYLAALVHNVGMLTIKEEILNKNSPLTAKEYTVIKTHPARGEEMVGCFKGLKETAPLVRQHHERYDGKGYPDGLKENKILPEARIIALAAAFVTMTAQDSYKKPLRPEAALKEIESNAGTQFDPELTGIMFKTIIKQESKSDQIFLED